MATTFSANLKLQRPALGDTGWSVPILADLGILDAIGPVAGLFVTTTEQPSTTLNVDISAGTFFTQDGTAHTFAGAASQLMTTAATNYLFLDGTAAWAYTKNTSGFPATPHVRLATVIAGASTISAATDARACFIAVGPWADGQNLSFGTTTGTQIGTANTQKIGFYGSAPVVQPTAALQAAVTDSTASSATATIPQVRNDTLAHAASDTNDGLHVLYGLVSAMRTALVNTGIIKGS